MLVCAGRSLSLSGSNIDGTIPLSITKLTALMHLDLSNNRLSSNVPESLAAITTLQFLNLSHNMFTGSPPVLTLQNLTGNRRLGASRSACRVFIG